MYLTSHKDCVIPYRILKVFISVWGVGFLSSILYPSIPSPLSHPKKKDKAWQYKPCAEEAQAFQFKYKIGHISDLTMKKQMEQIHL